jgi:hypothetical protein
MSSLILPPPRDSAPPGPELQPWEVERIVLSGAREAFAWVVCIGFVLGVVAAQILLAW